ncbi:MAG: MmcQ/YjbR family DNA-binding protein [Chitinophagales bacterium]|nr:MmcQ/YjbR family DNA-binding protein [Chitinophagales bacterium]
MNPETLRIFCLSLPDTTEDIKWGNDLCFCIKGKMFCVIPLDSQNGITLKVDTEEFDTLTSIPGISIAPYVGRYHWIHIENYETFSTEEWKKRISRSYELVLRKKK